MKIKLELEKDEIIRVMLSLEMAIKDMQNTIVTCPDPDLYKKELSQYAAELESLGLLHKMVYEAFNTSEQTCKLILLN